MASLKFEEAHVTKKVFPAYNMSVKNNNNNTFKLIFHLLNIVPLWISLKEENGIKNLQ